MANGQLRSVIRHLSTMVGTQQIGGLTDAQLVERFVHSRDEAAFEVLLWRHGPMVFHLCRRLLQHQHDIEDAFQATFLILVRKARTIGKGRSVGSWLYKVAYRVALETRAHAARRTAREKPLVDLPAPNPADDLLWRDLGPVLDEEVRRLPEKYRASFVLCCLEGKSREEAALELGCPKGTVASRLAWARQRLRERLARRGLVLTTGLFVEALTTDTAWGSAPVALVQLTMQGVKDAPVGTASTPVSVLAEGVMRAMFASKLKKAAVLALAVVVFVTGIGLAARQTFTARQPGTQPGEAAGPAALQPAQAKREHVHPPRTDRQGDPLPPGAIARMGTVRFRHGDAVGGVAFSPDGTLIASAAWSFEPSIRLWEAATGRQRLRIQAFGENNGGMLSLAYSPDGKTIATGGWMGRNLGLVDIWDATTGERLHRGTTKQGGILSVAFSPDGKLLASGDYDKSVRLWDVATRKEIRTCHGHLGAVYSVTFSPDGKTLSSAGEDEAIRLWSVADGKQSAVLKGHEKTVLTVAFSGDGKTLASGGRDGKIRLWELATQKVRRQLEGHTSDVAAVAFSRDGRSLASAGRDRLLLWWDVATGKEVRRFSREEMDFSSLTFSPDGKRLVAGGFNSGLCVWDVATGKEAHPFESPKGWVTALRYLPDGATLASGGWDGTIRLWDPRTGKELQRLAESQAAVTDLAFSPDGKALAWANYGKMFSLGEVATRRVIRKFSGHEKGTLAVAFSANGQALFSAGRDRTVREWNAATGKEVRSYTGAGGEHLALSANGKVLAAGGENGTIRVWETTSGKMLCRLGKDSGDSLALSSDGKTLVTGGDLIRLWDTATGTVIRKIDADDPGTPSRGGILVAISPDGRWLASVDGDRVVRLWEAATGKQVCRFEGHQGSIYAITFGPDGRTVASGSRDCTILVWDATGRTKDGQPPALLTTHEDLETRWTDLAGKDGPKAHQAYWALVASAKHALPYLKERVLPVPRVPPERLSALIADLDSEQFEVRERASSELAKLAAAVEARLRKILTNRPTPEVRRRIEQALDRVGNREQLRLSRAVGVLEEMASEEAVTLLRSLAKGSPDSRLTGEAQAALQRRLARQKGVKP
jgi:RNA polymerase sigma factor (sigma-70 family)